MQFSTMVTQVIQRAGFLLRSLTRRKLDAVDLLESDHIRVEMLFVKWRFANDRSRKEDIFEMIKKNLLEHMQLEETYFYPACEKIPETKSWVTDGRDEHKQIRSLLKDLSHINLTTEKASTKMKTLFKIIEHHVQEEENELFPKVRSLMKKTVLERLNRDFQVAKQNKLHKRAA